MSASSGAHPTHRDRAPGLETLVEERVQALMSFAQTIESDVSATIKPEETQRDSARLEMLASIPHRRSGVTLERTIGQGGMGLVRLGTQVALGRTVAVKTLRPDVAGRHGTRKLLQEAWVTGALEHPNVIPVYDLEINDDDRPVIVMKRIEGVVWGEVMHDGDEIRERFQVEDAFDWNLAIWTQVANAVAFAHSRGVVHRDIKPENVMIGAFGEVYVLDWGIAVAMSDDGSDRLPLAADATELAGTPAYMAPEMLGGDVPRISPRTDVYLLGATLFEILTGHPPHGGERLMQIVASVLSSPPDLPNDTSEDLAACVRRAMAAEPSERFDDVVALRNAVGRHREHRSSMTLADEATRRLLKLLALLESDDGADDAPSLGTQHRIYHQFGACRFGFRQALKGFPDNTAAREGIRRATVAMVEYELAVRDAKAAAMHLAELDDPPRALVERVEALREEMASERDRVTALEALGRDHDPSVGQNTRRVLGLLFGLTWTIGPIAMQQLFGLGETHVGMITNSVCLLCMVAATAIWARESMWKTALNRRVLALALIAVGAVPVAHIGAMFLGMNPVHTHVFHLLLWTAMAAVAAVVLDKLFAVTAIGYAAAFLLAAHFVELRFWAMTGANLFLTVVVAWIWRREPARA